MTTQIATDRMSAFPWWVGKLGHCRTCGYEYMIGTETDISVHFNGQSATAPCPCCDVEGAWIDIRMDSPSVLDEPYRWWRDVSVDVLLPIVILAAFLLGLWVGAELI